MWDLEQNFLGSSRPRAKSLGMNQERLEMMPRAVVVRIAQAQ